MSFSKENMQGKNRKEIAEAFRLRKQGTSKAKHNHIHFRDEVNEKLTYKSSTKKTRRGSWRWNGT